MDNICDQLTLSWDICTWRQGVMNAPINDKIMQWRIQFRRTWGYTESIRRLVHVLVRFSIVGRAGHDRSTWRLIQHVWADWSVSTVWVLAFAFASCGTCTGCALQDKSWLNTRSKWYSTCGDVRVFDCGQGRPRQVHLDLKIDPTCLRRLTQGA